jgi:hypothetical protein
MYRHWHEGQNQNIKTVKKSFESVEQFRYLGKTLTNKNSIYPKIKIRLKSGFACYNSIQKYFPFNLTIRKPIYQNTLNSAYADTG